MVAEIWGIGHCCQDFGCIVEQYPQEDGSTHILDIDDSQGGGAMATAMVAASRLGARTGIYANLGDDEVGDKILEGFKKEGVYTGLVKRIPEGRSSTSYVMVNPENGSRTKFPYRDQLPNLEWTDNFIENLKKAKILHLDGTQYTNALSAAKLAKKMGVAVSLDACSMQAENEKNLELASLADILITNEKYPCRVTGEETMEKALLKFAKMGPTVVAATMGNRGCLYIKDGEVKHMPAFKVKAVDTTGAGDTFHGAFLACWLKDKDVEHCLQFASAAAALKCEKQGGRAGIPNREITEKFLRQS